MPDAANVRLAPLAEARFGPRSARADRVTRDNLPAVMHFCQEHAVVFLVARCATTELPTAQRLEDLGFRLMDTLIYYKFTFSKKSIPSDTGTIPIRPVQPDDSEPVRSVALKSFKGYLGHYHADPRLDQAQADDAYVDWAVRSVMSRDVADEVLIAEQDQQVVGFATLKLNSPDEGEGVLFGVAPQAQGQGIYRSFIVRGLEWCAKQDRKWMVVSTQVTNIPVQKVWARVGFEADRSYYTFHKWFD